jgi:hypothetical protein
MEGNGIVKEPTRRERRKGLKELGVTPKEHRQFVREVKKTYGKKAKSSSSSGGGCAVAAFGVGGALLTGLATWRGWKA